MKTRSAVPRPDVVSRIPGPRMQRTQQPYPHTTPCIQRIQPQYPRTPVTTSRTPPPSHRTSHPTNHMVPIMATDLVNKPPISPRGTAQVTTGPRRGTHRVTPTTTAPVSLTVMRGRHVRADVVRRVYTCKAPVLAISFCTVWSCSCYLFFTYL